VSTGIGDYCVRRLWPNQRYGCRIAPAKNRNDAVGTPYTLSLTS